MIGYTISQIRENDKYGRAELLKLLTRENIKLDTNLDYTMGVYDNNYNLIATGSCYANTLRCIAVDSNFQGEGIMNQIVSHLVEYQMNRGNSHLFVYTKCDTAIFFSDFGFYEIARIDDINDIDDKISFMENKKNGFADYLKNLSAHKKDENSAVIIMNCNPFTLGHRCLIEKAASENNTVHVFIVSEDASFIPFADRYEMLKLGCSDLKNVILHETKSYMISNAVFPSYFLNGETEVVNAHAKLDITLFMEIAKTLGVKKRYVGEEPFSNVTNIYNQNMIEQLPKIGVSCVVIPRMSFDGKIISASYVRELIHDDKISEIEKYVPKSTFDFLKSVVYYKKN